MKIHADHFAPNPRRVRIFLAEKGIEVPYEPVDLMQRANRSPEFLAKNPGGSIPVLELDDGTCIAARLKDLLQQLTLLCTFDFATSLVEIPLDPAHSHLARWHAEVSARPSALA